MKLKKNCLKIFSTKVHKHSGGPWYLLLLFIFLSKHLIGPKKQYKVQLLSKKQGSNMKKSRSWWMNLTSGQFLSKFTSNNEERWNKRKKHVLKVVMKTKPDF